MAIIKTVKLPSGVIINIDDSCMAPKGSDEERKVIEAQRQAAYNILINRARMEVNNDEGKAI